MTRNRLAGEISPYLLQHADNPVDWMPWGPEALARARSERKPVLLSVGYAACHWCHVMAHESFEDPAIAALMNDRFVNIKVDREERPDLDTIYQSALAMLGQQGGWPLTMFLTADGEPFWGGTYFPKSARYGRPGFTDVLRAVADLYGAEPDKVRQNVDALRVGLDRLSENRAGGSFDLALLDEAAARLVGMIDPVWGGLGGPPKFPHVPVLELLWRSHLRSGAADQRDAVVRTLTAMCQGGLYDHLGGGFARYSTDAEWLAPHFEKMLYDNAQLVSLLTLVWQRTRTPLFEARIRETIGWVLDEMIAPGGGFAATLDADSEGEEGRFYVWTEAEIDAVLGAEAATFKQVYDVTPGGNWEHRTILNRRRQDGLADPATETALAAMRERLLAARAARVRPGWDDKVLADWNGLMIAALAEAALVFDEPAWLAAAERAFGFVRDGMGADGRLRHAARAGQVRHAGTLDDHALMARAALSLFEATGRPDYLDQARRWTAVLDRHFWDQERSGYFYTADDAEALIVRTKTAADNAVPAGNGVMVRVLGTLSLLTGETPYRERAEALVGAFSGELVRNVIPLATLLNGAEFLDRAVQIVLVGVDETSDGFLDMEDMVSGGEIRKADRVLSLVRCPDPAVSVLGRVVLDRSVPDRVLTVLGKGTSLPPGHPAAGKQGVPGHATVFLCVGQTCRLPVTTPEQLSAELDAVLGAVSRQAGRQGESEQTGRHPPG